MNRHQVYQGFLRQLTSSAAISQPPSSISPLSTTQETVIGRDPSCQIILDPIVYGGVSRRHLVVRPLSQTGIWEICDLNSANGTYVNGQRLQGNRILNAGDRIMLGQNGCEFSFEIRSLSPPCITSQTSASDVTSPPLSLAAPSLSTPAPIPASTLSVSQLVPILSTGRDLSRKAYLVPGILTVIFAVLMFATIGSFIAFAGVLAFYLAGAAYYFVYQLCGKSKPWWMLVGSALTTMLLVASPIFSIFVVVFRGILPGNVSALPENAGFLNDLFAHFFGAGLLEELLKALPVFAAYLVGYWLSSSVRDRIGVREPLDGILLGAASAVGFTLIETLGQYVPETMAQVTQQAGADVAQLVGLQLLIPRILASVAGHIAYSGYFGYFIGLSALKPSKRWTILTIGYLTASGLHAFWNATASIPGFGLILPIIVGGVSYAFLTASILKARALSPKRSQNFATHVKF